MIPLDTKPGTELRLATDWGRSSIPVVLIRINRRTADVRRPGGSWEWQVPLRELSLPEEVKP